MRLIVCFGFLILKSITVYCLPVDPPPSGLDFYIHRSGRTGRKGQSGRSVMVLSSDFRHRGGNEMNPEAFLRDVS